MSEFDLTRLRGLGELYERQRREAEETRREIMDEVQLAEAAGVTQADISRASGISRERFRQKRLAAERRAEKAAKAAAEVV